VSREDNRSAGLRLLREGFLYVLALFLLRAGNFLLIPLYLKLLTPEQYGAFGVVRHLINVLVPLVVVAQAHSVLRLGVDVEGDPDAREHLLGSVVTWILAASGLWIGLTVLAWPILTRWVPGVPLWPLGVAGLTVVVGQGLFQVSQAWLRHERRAKEHTVLALVRWAVMIGAIALFLGALKLGATGLLLSMGLSFAVASFIGLRVVVGLKTLGVHRKSLKESLQYGLPLLPHALASVLFQATDQVLLAAYDADGLNTAGLYLLAAQLTSAVHMFAQGLQKAWTPFYLREDRDRDEGGWRRVRILSFFAVAAVGGAAVSVGLFAPEVVWLAGVFSKNDWTPAAAVVPILVLGGYSRVFYLIAFAVVMGNKGVSRWIAVVTVPAAALNVFLNARWIPEHGMQGAASATVISWTVAALALGVLARKARAVPFKYVHSLVLTALVVVALWAGVGETLVYRIGVLILFVGALALLDGRDLVAAGRSLLKKA
jgi:O-antigen/teichoic acid export membrane protein